MKYLKQIIAASIAGMVCMTAYSDEVPVGAITGLYQEKTAVPNEDGESYKLTIDSYAVGSMVTEQTTTCLNADVVLVIDMSNSMFNNNTDINVADLDTSLFYSNDKYQPVAYKDNKWKYYDQSKTTWSDVTSDKVKTSRYSSTLSAAVRFLNNLRKDAIMFSNSTRTIHHKVKVISFNQNYYSWCDFLDVNSEYNDIISALLAMTKDGNTYPAQAIAAATTALNSSKGDTKNIVFFTDGAPESKGGEGGKTINNALVAKKKNYTVFSIGFAGTDLKTDFLDAVSSNFPGDSATISGDTYTIKKTDRKDDFYMRYTSDPMELTEYFEAVARSIAHAAKIYNLTTSTQIRDYITPDFKIKDWTSAKVKCYKVACTGFDSNNNPTFVGGGSTDITSTLTIDIPNDSVIKVSGFDFKANVCGKNSKTGAVYGNKLSIVFDIVPTATFKGGFNLDTNTPASGIYESNDTKADTIGTYPIPKVAAPVDLIVTASNLKYGESLLVTVTRDTTSAGTNKGKDGFKYELMLTGTQLEKQILKKVATKYKNYNDSATYYYFVDPQETGRTNSKSWDWRYEKTSNAPSHPLWDAKGDSLINVFPFTRTERTGIQSSDEDWSTSKKTH